MQKISARYLLSFENEKGGIIQFSKALLEYLSMKHVNITILVKINKCTYMY